MESSPYDEEYKLDDEDETSQVDLYTPSPRTHPQVKKERSNEDLETEDDSEGEEDDVIEGDDVTDGEEDDEDIIQKYDPKDFENLDVNDDIKHMFQLISQYNPQKVDIETKLLPFIPEFIPAVGDIDAFIKIPRPDGIDDGVGLLVLDEPASIQTDPGALELKLQNLHKGVAPQASVRRVQRNDAQALQKWIQSVRDIHAAAPAPSVQYSGPVPDIEQLMEEWPGPIQENIRGFTLPDGPLDLVIDCACGLLDIPITNRVHALHQLLTLYQAVNDTS